MTLITPDGEVLSTSDFDSGPDTLQDILEDLGVTRLTKPEQVAAVKSLTAKSWYQDLSLECRRDVEAWLKDQS